MAELSSAPKSLEQRLMELIFGEERANEYLDYAAKERLARLAELERQQSEFDSRPGLTAQIPGASPEASTGLDAITGMALSAGATGAAKPVSLKPPSGQIVTDRAGNVLEPVSSDVTPEMAERLFGPALKYRPGLREPGIPTDSVGNVTGPVSSDLSIELARKIFRELESRPRGR